MNEPTGVSVEAAIAVAAVAAEKRTQEIVDLILGGRFLHGDSPAAQFAREVAAAIRCRYPVPTVKDLLQAPSGERATLEEAEVSLRRIARMITPAIPPGWCWLMILASTGSGGFSTYLSTIDRDDSVKLMRETAQHIERREPNA